MESKIYPIISIIIPAYNSEKFIFRCINSIPIDKSIEIIIVDDFSKKILKNKINLKKFVNIKVFRNVSNQGPGYSRNFGIKKAKGKYILFLDSDDFLNKINILKLIKVVKNSKTDLYLCRYKKDHFPRDNLTFLKNLSKKIDRKKLIKKIIYTNFPIEECWSILFYREFLLKNKIFFPKNIRVGEDEYFLARVLTEFKNAKTYNETIYIHNDRKDSLSSNLSDYSSNVDFINLFYLFTKLYLKKKYKKNENLLLLKYLNVLYSRIISLLFIRNNQELESIVKLIQKNYYKELTLILDDLKIFKYKKLIHCKTNNKLNDLIKENIFEIKNRIGTSKNVYIYCKGLIAKSLIKICENLNIKIIAIIDDEINIKKKFNNYELTNSLKLFKNIKNKNLDYKIFIANNRKLTYEKIKKKLIKNKINSKKIIKFY